MAWTFLVVWVLPLDYGAATTLSATSAEQRTCSCALVLPLVSAWCALMLARAAACSGRAGACEDAAGELAVAVVVYGEVIRGVSARVRSVLLKNVTLLTTHPRRLLPLRLSHAR